MLAVGLLSCFVEGVIRESPVVLSAVSVSAVGFVDSGVLLSSLLKESSFAPAVGGLWGLQRAWRFLFLCFLVWCDEFGRSR